MRNLKFLPAMLGGIVALAVVLFVAFHFIFIDLFVDLWWYQSLNFESYFWLRLLYKFFLSDLECPFVNSGSPFPDFGSAFPNFGTAFSDSESPFFNFKSSLSHKDCA